MRAADKKRVAKDLGAAGLVLAGAVLASAVAGRLGMDLSITGLFYVPGKGFPYGTREPWLFLYHWGTLPGLLVTFACVAGLIGVALGRVPKAYRKPMMVFVLTTFVASAVLVNAVLKPYWGRPRPCQVTQFGGELQFQKVWPPGEPGRGRSFPSGHASMGFVLMALYAFVRVRPRMAKAGLGAGVAFGLLMGATRVVQGDHFTTDVLWAFATVAATALVLDAVIPEAREADAERHLSRRARIAGVAALGVAAVAALVLYLMARPFYESHRRFLWLGDKVHEVVLQSNVAFTARKVLYRGDGEPRIIVEARGFGVPWARWRLCAIRFYPPGRLVYVYDIETDGYLSELFYEAAVILPRSLEGRVPVRFEVKKEFPFRRATDP